MSALSDTTTEHELFEIGVFLKGVHGLIETIGAIALYFVNGTTLLNIITSVTSGEIREDPNDVLAGFVMRHAHITATGKDFIALYLFISGITNIGLSLGLLLHKKRAFPIALAILAVFVLYQAHLYMRTHSLWLVLLIAYDAVLIKLVYDEYRRRWPLSASFQPHH